MRVASSAVLPHDLEDFVRILFGEAEALFREARTDVNHEGGSAMLHDRARHAVEPVVRPPFLDTRIDDDRHALADLEGLQRPRDGGEPALARTAAELLPRLLHDAFRGLDHLLTRRRGRRARRARAPRTPRRVVLRGTAASGPRPRGPTP